MWANEKSLGKAAQAMAAVLRPPKPPKREHNNSILWVQIVLCVLFVAGVFLVKQNKPIWYGDLQKSYKSIFGEQADLKSELMDFVQVLYAQAAEFADALAKVSAEAGERFADSSKESDPFEPIQPYGENEMDSTHLRAHNARAPSGCSLEPLSPGFEMLWPLRTEESLRVTSPYGWRTHPLTGAVDFHTGVDLAATEGTVVFSVAEGYVRAAGYSASYGNHLRILHRDGSEALYAHMQFLFVHQGQFVTSETLLGTSGQTGNVTGPHLHFELLWEGVRYQPENALGL